MSMQERCMRTYIVLAWTMHSVMFFQQNSFNMDSYPLIQGITHYNLQHSGFELRNDISLIIQFDRAKDHCSKKLSPVKLQKR